MDNTFPKQLFPNFYPTGEQENKPRHRHAGWGSYGGVLESNVDLWEADKDIPHAFESQHIVRGDQWVPVKPAVLPLIPACEDVKVFSGPLPDPMVFPEHIQYFYQHYYMDAFSTMGHSLEKHFTFKNRNPGGVMSLNWANRFIEGLSYKRCEIGHFWERIRHYHQFLGDVLSDVPQTLLSELLHEELTSQREQQLFSAELTGGALGYMSLHQTRDGGDGCLIYPSGTALDTLNFHRVVPEYHIDKPPSFFMDSKPFGFKLNGTVRQISLGNMEDTANVGVRSDYFCSSWAVGDGKKPRLQEVIQTKERFSCVTVSPHVPDELVVATEQGSAYLWTVRKGMQKFRQEDSNLYFDMKSPWRWCEFSCHPRVMVFADRTGAELTDARNRNCYHTLFRFGKMPDCKTEERVILSKYLSESHPNHHLITTQFSAYIMDERVPCVPMLKWNHMMDSQPIFACVLPGLTKDNSCKVLLGAQRSQEVMLLQYKGGREHACQSQGPIQKLFSPSETLSHLKLLYPHKKHIAQRRLGVPAAGLTAVQNKDFLSVFQITETGDIFYQTLKLHKHDDLVVPASSVILSNEDASSKNDSDEVRFHARDDDSTIDTDSGDEMRPTVCGKSKVMDSVDKDQSQDDHEASYIDTKDLSFQEVWNRWLQPLFKQAASKKRHLRHQQIKTKGLISLEVSRDYTQEKDHLESLKKDLHNVMSKKELLIHSVTNLPELSVMPVPNPIDPNKWTDDLSQRLAASWDNNWKNWWDEKLGLNRDEKIKELRKKRQREKKGRKHLSLSGSFTSSVGYQDNLSDWSSAGSHYLGSDEEVSENTGDIRTQEMNQTTPATTSAGEPLKSALKKSKQDLVSPSKTQMSPPVTDSRDMPSVSMTPTKRPKRQPFDFASWFGSQKPALDSEPEGGFPLSQMSSSSQLSLSSPRISKVRGLSQSSQPKKKSRMGF